MTADGFSRSATGPRRPAGMLRAPRAGGNAVRRGRAVFAALWTLASSSSAESEPVAIDSPLAQVQLLELFTSEGCSSCPPAERWLSGLKREPRLWRQVVPVAFHVDYWNALGWVDRLAAPEHARRQRLHALGGGVSAVYTPGFVLNGAEWRGWLRSGRLVLEPNPLPEVGRLRLVVDGEQVRAAFFPTRPATGALELHCAVLGFGLRSEVRAGENAGRRLEHDFAALGYRRVALRSDGRGHTARLALPASRAAASVRALAAWVSRAGEPRPIQAAGGWLPN